MAAEFEAALAAVLAREVRGFEALSGCRQLTAGASQETYRVSFTAAGAEQQLALRRAQPNLGADSSVGAISLAFEAKLLQLAGEAGVPVPDVTYVLTDADSLGEGFLMEWLDGETMGQRILRSPELAEVRPQLAFQCGQALAKVHQVDWHAAQLDKQLPVLSAERVVDETYAAYKVLNTPQPMIDYTWRWLKDNLPNESRMQLVHGDFRNGNLMIDPSGIRAVLDWELAHIGDPVRDLGWLCVNSWRFGKRELPVGGFGERAQLLAGYADVSGVEVSEQDLKFWEVFGSFWWAMATLQMANTWRTGETPSLERPVIGRRSSEAQMDCVNLIIPGTFELPMAQDADGNLVQPDAKDFARGTQLPMAAELLSGPLALLKDTVPEKLDPHNAFLAKVAANSLGIAQRELLYGPALAEREAARLRALLGGDGNLCALREELVQQLRSGMPTDTPGLAEHLRKTVAGQLAIDQPKYSALRR